MVRNIADLRKSLIRKTKEQVREHYSVRDVHIARAIVLLDDLDEVFNLFSEHLREWYSVHFPEMNRVVKDNEAAMRLIYNLGKRSNFSKKQILEHYKDEERAAELEKVAVSSAGAAVNDADLSEMKLLALNALNIKEEREYLAKYLEKTMDEIAHNFSTIAGALVGAKLLAKAGSLKRLALMPSSTIQLLGAEKALFQAKKSHGKLPKYGYIYQHPMVKAAKPFNKGKLARSLAGKLSIAARQDFFGKDDISKELQKDLDQRVSEVEKLKPKQKVQAEKPSFVKRSPDRRSFGERGPRGKSFRP